MDAKGLLAGLRQRHTNSTQGQSRALVAVIDSIVELIKSENMELTTTAVFGASMSPLEDPQTLADLEVVTALCTVLSTVMQHMPIGYVRSKFDTVSAVIVSIVKETREKSEKNALKAALACLIKTLCCLDTSGATWASAKQPLLLLMDFTMSDNPKVRKLAHEGVTEVMATVRSTPAQQHASREVLQVARMVLLGPKLAAKAASEAAQSKRDRVEAAIVKSVQDCLHFMGALKPLMAMLSEDAAMEVCEHLLKLFVLQQPLLSRHAADCLTALVAGSSDTGALSAGSLQSLIKAVASLDGAFAQRDADTIIRLTQFGEEALAALARADPPACAATLPSVFLQLVPNLAAPQDGVRLATAGALRSVLSRCVTPDMVASAAADASAGVPPRGLVRVILSLAGVLGASYRDAWPTVLPVVSHLFERLGPAGAGLVDPLLVGIASMCRGAADADDRSSLAEAAIGASIAAQGPQSVLAAIPLTVDPLHACDTWLLPILRRHVAGSELAFFGTYILPRARHVGALAVAAAKAGRAAEHLKLAALELQLWNLLYSFANWARDLPVAIAAQGDTLGLAFHNRPDLQVPICNALVRMCTQTSAALNSFGDADGAGFGAACARDGAANSCADDDDAGGAAPPDASTAPPPANPLAALSSMPSDFSLADAQSNRAALRPGLSKWLTELLNRFAGLAPEERGALGDTIRAAAVLAGEGIAVGYYRAAMAKLIPAVKALQGPASEQIGDVAGEFTTFLELALLLAPGLSDAAMGPLLKVICPALTMPVTAVQKKAYKAFAYLCTDRPAFLRANLNEVLALLTTDASAVQAAAKRHRLLCLKPTILLLSSPECPDLAATMLHGKEVPSDRVGREVVTALIAELILCTKEVNQKTRTHAYELLVSIAHAMHEGLPPQLTMDGDIANVDDLSNGGLQQLFGMILAGLASQAARMVSASVMALARLLFEFGPHLEIVVSQLLPPVCMLLRSKAREVIKAVLGFLKVCSMRIPVPLLTPHLRIVVEGVLLWAEDSKNRFKLKVRHLVERLCRRCGTDAVAAVFPEQEAKLLVAIRKDQARKVRRKADAAGEDDDDDATIAGWADGARSRAGGSVAASSVGGCTARASEWGHSNIFSEGGETARTARTGKSKGGGPSGGTLGASSDEPMDLLDMSASRQLSRTAAGVAPASEVDDYARDAGSGKMVIVDEERAALDKNDRKDPFADPFHTKRKRTKPGYESDDSDLDDLRGIGGLDRAVRDTKGARSMTHAKSVAHTHATARTNRTHAASHASKATSRGTVTGARFKAKKAEGDSHGGATNEPFAYWKLDKSLLNSRKQKAKGASKQLGNLLLADAPRQGGKAKAQVKRRKRE